MVHKNLALHCKERGYEGLVHVQMFERNEETLAEDQETLIEDQETLIEDQKTLAADQEKVDEDEEHWSGEGIP